MERFDWLIAATLGLMTGGASVGLFALAMAHPAPAAVTIPFGVIGGLCFGLIFAAVINEVGRKLSKGVK